MWIGCIGLSCGVLAGKAEFRDVELGATYM